MRSLLVVALLAGSADARPHVSGSVALLVDRSGSMQGPKLEAAKQAALAAVAALDPTDQVEIIAFDSEATVVVPLQPAANRVAIGKQLAELRAGGGTTFAPALQLAFDALHETKGPRHVVLLTDGEGPTDGVDGLGKRMRDAKITVTAIGVQGADRNFLAQISEATDGVLYMVENPSALPKIFAQDVKKYVP